MQWFWWATCVALVVASSASARMEQDSLYEEVVATRLTFTAGPSGFPVLPFREVAHAAPLGETTVAILARNDAASGSEWGLFAVDNFFHTSGGGK